jgi:hypothetical protein
MPGSAMRAARISRSDAEPICGRLSMAGDVVTNMAKVGKWDTELKNALVDPESLHSRDLDRVHGT